MFAQNKKKNEIFLTHEKVYSMKNSQIKYIYQHNTYKTA